MIEASELTERYGGTTAVHSLSFTIAPGTVTGFLGPNGAGKSTTMRMIMGLDRPTSGTAPSTESPTGSTVPRYARSAPCSTPVPCTPAAAPAHTCEATMARPAWAWMAMPDTWWATVSWSSRASCSRSRALAWSMSRMRILVR